MPESLQNRIHLEEIEATRLYRGDVVTDLQRAFGGQVLAESILAAYGRAPDDRLAHSLHAYFLLPGRTDMPVIYDVETTREGSSFTSTRVLARQNGKNILQSAVSFHRHEPGLDHSDSIPPDLPDPDMCPPLSQVLGQVTGRNPSSFDKEWQVLDVRYINDSGSGSITPLSHRSHLRLWVRTSQPLPDKLRWHQAALAYMSDLTLLSVSTLTHRVTFGGPQMQVASIDHAMWWHRPVRADRWVLYDQVSPSASEALGFSMGRMFQDGQLVASCTQEGLIRVLNE